MPLNPLDLFKGLKLPGFASDTPELTPEQRAVADAKTTEAQSHDPGWMKAGRSALDGIVGVTKGALGIGDQGPAGATATNFGQILAAGLPMINGLKGAGLPGMYSRVDAAAEQLPSALHPSKAEGIFRDNAAKEEVDFRGLSDFLKNQQGPKVTKQEIVQHLEQHPMPEIGVKTLGAAAPIEDARFTAGFQPNDTRYSRPSLNVPGGENYRERLLTLPTKEWSSADPTSMEQAAVEPVYQSGHWDEPNVLAHSRFDERSLDPRATQTVSSLSSDEIHRYPQIKQEIAATKGRFLQEVQSDWHQAGKERGYVGDSPIFTDEDHANAFYARDAIQQELIERYHNQLGDLPHHPMPARRAIDALRMAGATPEEVARLEQAQQHLETVHAQRGGPIQMVPNAPFKESWPDLVLKEHVLDVAHNPDLNWLGFTTGDTQNQRYGLSHHVQNFEYHPATGTLDVELRHHQTGDPAGRQSFEVTPDQLHTIVGRDMAQRIMESPDTLIPDEVMGAGAGNWHTVNLSADDGISIGGKGMKTFYDQKLPSALSRILKPFGGKVEQTRLPASLGFSGDNGVHTAAGEQIASVLPRWPERDASYDRSQVVRDNHSDTVQQIHQNAQQVMQQIQRQGTAGTPAWIAHLPPEMKKAIMEKGLPLLMLMGMMHEGQDGSQGAQDGALSGLKQVGR